MNKVKLDEYLYQITYSDIDYNYAYDYYKQNSNSIIGGCTSFRLGDYFGRNYDWVYDNSASFVVITPESKYGRKVIGIAGGIKELTNSFVESGQVSELYKLVPFALLDGINDSGLVVSMNVVPTDYGDNVSIPNARLINSICNLMIPRFILDKFSTAKEAISYLRDYCSIFNSKKLSEIGYEIHFIISDKSDTFVIEIVNDRLNIIKHNIITNFHITDVNFNKDGKVYTPETQSGIYNAFTFNNITKNGCGLERYNLVADLKTFGRYDVLELLKNLRYSNTYKNLNWFTEFVGNDLTVNSTARKYIEHIIPILPELEYKSRENSKLWQTVHTTLYDIPNKSFELRVQENFDKVFKYSLK